MLAFIDSSNDVGFRICVCMRCATVVVVLRVLVFLECLQVFSGQFRFGFLWFLCVLNVTHFPRVRLEGHGDMSVYERC